MDKVRTFGRSDASAAAEVTAKVPLPTPWRPPPWLRPAAMGVLLAIHLGVVIALFATMPYGKFVHGIYRFAALVRAARERHTMVSGA